MTQRRYISVWLVLLSLALLQAQNASAQSRMHLGKAKLVSPGVGWATVQQYPNEAPEGSSLYSTCLYWTQDNGKKWRDITPPHTSLQTLSEVFFLDSSFGWVILTETGLEDNNMGFHLLSTRDAGKTWVSLPVLQGTTYKLMDGMSPSEIFFSDSQHGWLVWYWHTMNSTATSLLATADGGRTWKRLPDPPGAGPLDFTSPRDGWMVGGPENQVGIVRLNSQLWATHDGGVRWKRAPMPVPVDSPEQGTYLITLKFKNKRDGMLAAGVERTEGGATFRFVGCVTHDGGKTWQFYQFDALSANPSIGDKHIFWSIFDRDTKKVAIQKDDHIIPFTLPIGLFPEGRLSYADFVDDSNAWSTYFNGPAGMVLLATSDGGKTSEIITPPLPAQTPLLPSQH